MQVAQSQQQQSVQSQQMQVAQSQQLQVIEPMPKPVPQQSTQQQQPAIIVLDV